MFLGPKCERTGSPLALMNGRITVSCRTAEALSEIWAALDAVEAQAVRLPLGHPAVTALAD